MKRITHWLLNISFILALAGMIAHEVIPHHHHNDAGEVHACCESHHDDEPESTTETTCTILSSIRLENKKPEIQIHSQELKHNHGDLHLAIAECCYHLFEFDLSTKTPLYIPQAVFYDTSLTTSLSHRGPPTS